MSPQSNWRGQSYIPVFQHSERPPAIAVVPAMSWIVLTDNLILALPVITRMGRFPIPQNKRVHWCGVLTPLTYNHPLVMHESMLWKWMWWNCQLWDGAVPWLRGGIWQGLCSLRNTEHLTQATGVTRASLQAYSSAQHQQSKFMSKQLLYGCFVYLQWEQSWAV